MNTELLGKTIKKERELNKLTVSELSRLSGVSIGVISNLENNKGKIPSAENLYRITRELEIDIGVLLQVSCKRDDENFNEIAYQNLYCILHTLLGNKAKALIKPIYKRIHNLLGDAMITINQANLKKVVIGVLADSLTDYFDIIGML